MLLDVGRTAVKYPEQRLLVEALDLGLDRLNIGHAVTIGQPELPRVNSGPRRVVVEERVRLGGDESVSSKQGSWSRGLLRDLLWRGHVQS